MSSPLSMFTSATVKLTAWYLGIIVSISLLFSAVIYSIATTEVRRQIDTLQAATHPADLHTISYRLARDGAILKAQDNLVSALLFTNICIWLVGGVGSYYLAKRTLRPIEEAHEAQSRFTSDASHELRTPLASMKLELEVALRDKKITKAELQELLASNLEEVNKLTNLAHTLLQLSRLDYDKIVREKVDIASALTSAANQFAVSKKRIHIKLSTPLYTHANQSNVEELATILIDNALKYSPEKSIVRISPFRKKQMVGFRITNEGKGIDAATLPHIFDRFYRQDSSRTSQDNKSYGLGLSLAKKIVEFYHGDLSVTSGKDAPTTFTVLLPRYTKERTTSHSHQ